MRVTEYDHAVEAVPSQNLLGLRNLVILRLSVPKIRFDNNGDEVRQGPVCVPKTSFLLIT